MVLEISPLAYYKLILHCLKYPHCAVNGVLLGKVGKGTLHALDAIPLFHLSLGTTPLQEVALTQVRPAVTCDDIDKTVWHALYTLVAK